MGKQRSKILRGKAEALIEMYPEKFKEDFEHNKKELEALKIFPNKISRNIVAGTLSKLVVKEEL